MGRASSAAESDFEREQGLKLLRENDKIEDALTGVDEAKRATLTRLLTGSAFVAPIVASFALDGLTISKAQAAIANGSGILGPV
jgi:hypothetical protein